MAIPVIMPRQGQSVETCIITKWFKQKGDTVKAGDLLFSYETDKAAFDVESPADGKVLEIYYPDGAEVPVLVNVAFIGKPGEKVEPVLSPVSAESGKPEKVPGPSDTKIPDAATLNSVEAEEAGDLKIRISPRAKRFAEKKSLDYYGIQGSDQTEGSFAVILKRLFQVTHSGERKPIHLGWNLPSNHLLMSVADSQGYACLPSELSAAYASYER